MARIFIILFALIARPVLAESPSSDLTNVRGFNYTTSLDTSISPQDHSALWLKYDAAQVERDLTQRLNLNQVRVFIAYSAGRTTRGSPTAQLVPMREPPTRAVELIRNGPPDIPALQALVRRWISILEPYVNFAPRTP